MKIGVDIGGNHIGIAVIDNETIVEKREKDLIKANEFTIIEFIVNNSKYFISKYKNLELLGISVCGTVKGGVIEKSVNLDMDRFEIVNELKKDIKLPIIIRNDAKCAALAEKKYGIVADFDDAVFLTIGTGIGGAYFINGKLVEPKRYSGFEFGHMVINKDGLLCSCGVKGCLEQYASINSLKRDVKTRLNIDRQISGIELIKLLEINAGKVKDIVEEFSYNLAIGISNIINLLEPEVVVLGGSFSHYKDIFLDKVKQNLKLFNNSSIPIIEVAKLKNEAGLIGSTIII